MASLEMKKIAFFLVAKIFLQMFLAENGSRFSFLIRVDRGAGKLARGRP